MATVGVKGLTYVLCQIAGDFLSWSELSETFSANHTPHKLSFAVSRYESSRKRWRHSETRRDWLKFA